MPTYHLQIDLDNAAFWGEDDVFNGYELSRILTLCAQRASMAVDVNTGEEAPLRDYNGNCVGREWITE